MNTRNSCDVRQAAASFRSHSTAESRVAISNTAKPTRVARVAPYLVSTLTRHDDPLELGAKPIADTILTGL